MEILPYGIAPQRHQHEGALEWGDGMADKSKSRIPAAQLDGMSVQFVNEVKSLQSGMAVDNASGGTGVRPDPAVPAVHDLKAAKRAIATEAGAIQVLKSLSMDLSKFNAMRPSLPALPLENLASTFVDKIRVNQSNFRSLRSDIEADLGKLEAAFPGKNPPAGTLDNVLALGDSDKPKKDLAVSIEDSLAGLKKIAGETGEAMVSASKLKIRALDLSLQTTFVTSVGSKSLRNHDMLLRGQ